MDTALWIASGIVTASMLAWTWLALSRGWFWRTDQRLEGRHEEAVGAGPWPSVAVVVPARNEAQVIPRSLSTLLNQDYPGPLHIFLVDDVSEDGTAEVAREVARVEGSGDGLTVVQGEPLPPGWTGKVWALHQGVRAARDFEAEYLWFTDADIAHSSGVLRALVSKAVDCRLDMVSVMAQLRASSPWERVLIPAFVFFFTKIYPFRWVNDHRRPTAAAAGGCMLVRGQALEDRGGFEEIKGSVIDDCSLARLLRGGDGGGRLWLGLSHDVTSLRAYNGLGVVWTMVRRSAYSQLNYSALNLVGTVVGMLMLYMAPPLATVAGITALVTGQALASSMLLVSAGVGSWAVMSAIYLPMLRWHRVSVMLSPVLPATAMLYTLMTIDSAWRTLRGQGGGWKGRTYETRTPGQHLDS
ncbi:MAG: glycosyltransferase [Chloroflexi bacterium]|nr:glycosyltransferase [Chloroflexota bacterium]